MLSDEAMPILANVSDIFYRTIDSLRVVNCVSVFLYACAMCMDSCHHMASFYYFAVIGKFLQQPKRLS